MTSQQDPPGGSVTVQGEGGSWAAPRSSSSSSTEEPVLWQWEHKKGWRDYDADCSNSIEEAYGGGQPMVRLQAGKDGQTIMELFFEDMIQHDTKTTNKRKIRRVGPETCKQKLWRKASRWLLAIESGRPYRMSFEQYRRQREEYLESLEQTDFDATVLYYSPSESRCARVARHPLFFVLTMCTVMLNALWLGYDANENTAPTIYEAPTHFLVVEQIFCIFFTLELLLRFGAFRYKSDFRKDAWFVFDLVLVLMMAGETWLLQPLSVAVAIQPEDSLGDFSVLRLMRLLKLTRLTRFVRLLHFCPDMLTMLRGIGRAMVSVFFTTLLLVVLLYIFGIIFKTQGEAFPDLHETFPTVGDSMWWLLLHGTFLDAISDVVPELRAQSPVMTTLFMVFTFFSHLTLLNMLVGILCEVVTQVSKTEKEQAAVSAFKAHLLPILKIYAVANEGRLRKQEFDILMQNPEVKMILDNLGVDADDFKALKDILYEDKSLAARSLAGDSDSDEEEGASSRNSPPEEPDLTFPEFMESALRLRGGNQARVQDIVELREYVKNRVDELAPTILSQVQRTLRAETPATMSRSNTRPRSRSSEGGIVRVTPPNSDELLGVSPSPLRTAGADVARPEEPEHPPAPSSLAPTLSAGGGDAVSRELAELRAEVRALREQALVNAAPGMPDGSGAQEPRPGSTLVLEDLALLRGEVREISDRLESVLRRRPGSPQPDEVGNLGETV